MDYARALGVEPEPEDYPIHIAIRPEDDREAAAVLAAANIEGPFVAFHAARGLSGPFAQASNDRALRMTRVNWPVVRFAEIGNALSDAFGLPVVLSGGDAISDVIRDIGLAMRRPNAVIAGKTSLRGLAAIYRRATVVVALDSGPMHVAAAAGAPTLGIFALRTDLPQRWGPIGRCVGMVPPSYACPRGCRKETCKTFLCYYALSPDVIATQARQLAWPEAAAPTLTPPVGEEAAS
jgi:ADP-heptose:LPS heptosyltransferase